MGEIDGDILGYLVEGDTVGYKDKGAVVGSSVGDEIDGEEVAACKQELRLFSDILEQHLTDARPVD